MEHSAKQHLGNYRLIRSLGQGGYAHVYLGEHMYLKTRAAIKVLRVHLSREHEQDFLREAQTLAHLEHPHIVRVLDFGVQEGAPFLVMQYAPKGSMRTTHPGGSILSATTILPYLKDVASALQYAHERKVIHRDVKPENMLMGPHKRVLLSDFGLAVVSHSAPQQQNVAGTVSYMAPEQIQGYPYPASDQYALGVVVYEWLCGVLPFVGSALEVATQHLTATPLPLRERNSALSAAIEQVVFTALAKKPDQRFDDITAFVRAFEQAVLADGPDHQIPDLPQSPSVPSRHIESYQQHSLVGRTQERECLSRLLRETEQQSQQSEIEPSMRMLSVLPSRAPSAFLLGDAGIGKTRLAEELGREAQQREWVVVQTRSYAQESHIPYRIWIDVLRSLVTQKLWQPQEERLPSHLSQALAALLPELTNVLSREDQLAPHLSKVEPFWIWEAVLMLLMAACKRRPLLLLLDDLHWADTSSIELFSYLIRHIVDAPVLLVGTCRESDVPITPALQKALLELQRERLMLQLHLLPLTDAQIGLLIQQVPEPLIPYIQQHAAGNPFFAEELARACLLKKGDNENTATSSSTRQHTLLPQSITAVLDQSLNKLSHQCQQFLRCAAVLESAFSMSTLSLMHTGSTKAEGEEAVLSLLEEAMNANVLLEEGSGSNIRYYFRHPLLQSRLYETLSATRKALLHRQAAETLRVVYAAHEGEGLALITHHLVQGGAGPQIIADHAERTANHAYTLAAYSEAERYYRLALEQRMSILNEIQEKQQEQVVSREEYRHQVSLLGQLGECLRIQGHYEEARNHYEQAIEILDQHVATYETPQERHLLAMLCTKLGQTWTDASNFLQAKQCYELSEQILQDAGILSGTAKAKLSLEQSYLLWHQGFYEDASHFAEDALLLFAQAIQQQNGGGTRSTSVDQIYRTLEGDPADLGRTHVLLALITTELGQCNDSLDHLNHALAVFEEHHCQREIAITSCDLGDFYLRKADYTQAQSILHRSLSIAESVGDMPLIACVLLNLGLLQMRTGKLVSAEILFRRGIAKITSLNDSSIATPLHACLGIVLQEQGEDIEAIKVACNALRISRKGCKTPVLGFMLIALAQLRIAQAIGATGKPEVARARLLARAKNTLERAFTMPGLEAEAKIEGQLALAQVELLEGAIKNAHQHALHALEMVHQFELLWLVPHAHALLGSISAALSQDKQAHQYFGQARREFRNRGMRLAYGRTLQQYGLFLSRRETSDSKTDRQGRLYLLKAHEIFQECNAKQDLQQLEQLLENSSDSSSQEITAGK